MKISLSTKTGVALFLMMVASWSCRQGPSGPVISVGDDAGGRQDNSKLTAVNINLPDRDSLKDKNPDIENLMDSWHLIVKPTGADCVTPTNIDAVKEYVQDAKLEAKLKQGCDYSVTLELGKKIVSAHNDDVF